MNLKNKKQMNIIQKIYLNIFIFIFNWIFHEFNKLIHINFLSYHRKTHCRVPPLLQCKEIFLRGGTRLRYKKSYFRIAWNSKIVKILGGHDKGVLAKGFYCILYAIFHDFFQDFRNSFLLSGFLLVYHFWV